MIARIILNAQIHDNCIKNLGLMDDTIMPFTNPYLFKIKVSGLNSLKRFFTIDWMFCLYNQVQWALFVSLFLCYKKSPHITKSSSS